MCRTLRACRRLPHVLGSRTRQRSGWRTYSDPVGNFSGSSCRDRGQEWLRAHPWHGGCWSGSIQDGRETASWGETARCDRFVLSRATVSVAAITSWCQAPPSSSRTHALSPEPEAGSQASATITEPQNRSTAHTDLAATRAGLRAFRHVHPSGASPRLATFGD